MATWEHLCSLRRCFKVIVTSLCHHRYLETMTSGAQCSQVASGPNSTVVLPAGIKSPCGPPCQITKPLQYIIVILTTEGVAKWKIYIIESTQNSTLTLHCQLMR